MLWESERSNPSTLKMPPGFPGSRSQRVFPSRYTLELRMRTNFHIISVQDLF